jgi:hypothetical protein
LKTTTNPIALEKELNKRLKMMGYLLLVFAVIAFVWDYFPSAEDELDQILIELEEIPPPISPYVSSSSFAIVGIACLLFYWKKKASFGDNPPS